MQNINHLANNFIYNFISIFRSNCVCAQYFSVTIKYDIPISSRVAFNEYCRFDQPINFLDSVVVHVLEGIDILSYK